MADSRTRDDGGSLGAATPPQPKWQWSEFDGLSPRDVYEMLALRGRVFVVEQDCVFPDADGRDFDALHLLGWAPDSHEGKLIVYARIFAPGVRYEEMSIGRIVTAPEVRGTGIGKMILRESMRRCAEIWPGKPIRIAAQRRLEKFYRDFGFVPDGEAYIEDEIEHIDMVRKTAN